MAPAQSSFYRPLDSIHFLTFAAHFSHNHRYELSLILTRRKEPHWRALYFSGATSSRKPVNAARVNLVSGLSLRRSFIKLPSSISIFLLALELSSVTAVSGIFFASSFMNSTSFLIPLNTSSTIASGMPANANCRSTNNTFIQRAINGAVFSHHSRYLV